MPFYSNAIDTVSPGYIDIYNLLLDFLKPTCFSLRIFFVINIERERERERERVRERERESVLNDYRHQLNVRQYLAVPAVGYYAVRH